MPMIVPSSLISEEECMNIIEKYTKEPSDLVDFKIAKFSENVIGFLGEHFSLIITFKSKSDDKASTVKFFVKTVPQSDYHGDMVTTSGFFSKEIAFYKNLLPKLLKISSRPFAPQCYLASEKLIVLEDLKNKGYEMVNSTSLSFEQMVGLLKTIARFHASSIIFEEERSTPELKYRIIDHYQEELKETTFAFEKGQPRFKWAVTVCECIRDLMKLQTKYKDIEAKRRKLKHIILTKMEEFIKPSKVFRNVINHDDLWCNNVMFNEEQDALIIDYQLTRYVPPAYDVLIALYLNNRRHILEQNWKHLLAIYYDTLSIELSLHNIDIENIYTKKQFDDSIEFYRLPALVESVMYGTITYISQELSDRVVENLEVFDDFILTNRSKYVIREYLLNETFKHRFNEVFYPLIEYLGKY